MCVTYASLVEHRLSGVMQSERVNMIVRSSDWCDDTVDTVQIAAARELPSTLTP